MAHKAGTSSNLAPGAGAKTDARTSIVDALLKLAGEQRFEDITISAICEEAKISLADFRDVFPSKGSVLAGLNRRIDRGVLERASQESGEEAAKERLFDVLMRRLDVMAPYREALREITEYLRRDPMAALAFNPVLVNSLRFMLEAAGIPNEGAAGALKLQGLALAWGRIVEVWLDDEDPGLAKTMAELDRVLTRGERSVNVLDRLDDFAAPLKALTRAAFETRHRATEGFRRRARSGSASKGGASQSD